MSFISPYWLLLLPLACLPFLISVSDKFLISNINIFHEDNFSKKINVLTKIIMSLIIVILILILANPWAKSSTITQVGKGAQLVFVIDRSVSMSKPFIGGDNENKTEIKSLATRRILKDFIQKRPLDMIGIVGFSNSALYGSKITKNRSPKNGKSQKPQNANAKSPPRAAQNEERDPGPLRSHQHIQDFQGRIGYWLAA